MNAPSQPEKTLEERVLSFLQTRNAAENIDRLNLTRPQQLAEKADFFLANRAVVCEVKSLQTDTKAKIDRITAPLLESEHAPVFYGAWKLDDVVRSFPNGQEIKKEVFDLTTSAIQTLFRKANRQIRTTKEVFGLPKAEGALVIVNDMVEILSPEVIYSKIGSLFAKRTPDGAFQFQEIKGVWVICETHFVKMAGGMDGIPAFILGRDGKTVSIEVIEQMQSEWAKEQGLPLFEMNTSSMDTLDFKPAHSSKSEDPTKLSLHGLWRRNYDKNPYLRNLNEEELGKYYQNLIAAITPGLLINAPKEALGQSVGLMERFTHFIQEANKRGLDLKKYAPMMRALGEDFRAGKPPSIDISEIEAQSSKTNVFEVGKFYTNAYDENYRCTKVENGTATLIFMAVFQGKSLDMIVGVDQPKWKYYWPMVGQSKIEALEMRYQSLVSKNPSVAAFESSAIR